MTLDEARAELYQLPPENFVDRRKELAAQARAAKDRELVKQITALRRPTRSAWLINLLAHERPGAVGDLLALGEELATAQRRMAGDVLRTLSGRRRSAIDDLVRQIVQLGHDHGYDAPDAARQEISQTLQAALADREVAGEVRAGVLTQTVVYGGFGTDDLTAALAASTTAAQAKLAAVEAPPDDAEPEPAEDPAAVAEREHLRATAEQAREAAERAESEAENATDRADELADRVERLRADLRAAETEEREAREAARQARKSYTQLRQVAATAAAAAEA